MWTRSKGKIMLYPIGTSVTSLLKKFPALREGLPLCECEKKDLRVYYTQKSVGIECYICRTSIWQRRCEKDNKELLRLITGDI